MTRPTKERVAAHRAFLTKWQGDPEAPTSSLMARLADLLAEIDALEGERDELLAEIQKQPGEGLVSIPEPLSPRDGGR